MASQLAWTSIAKALAHLHQQADLLPATGEVRESSRVATMHPRGWCATEWATRVSLSGNCRDVKHLQDVIDIRHQACASILDKLVDTCAPRGEYVAGNREDLAPLFEGKVCRNQRAAGLWSFGNQYAKRET